MVAMKLSRLHRRLMVQVGEPYRPGIWAKIQLTHVVRPFSCDLTPKTYIVIHVNIYPTLCEEHKK